MHVCMSVGMYVCVHVCVSAYTYVQSVWLSAKRGKDDKLDDALVCDAIQGVCSEAQRLSYPGIFVSYNTSFRMICVLG